MSDESTLLALSPLDGRYFEKTRALVPFFQRVCADALSLAS